MQLTALPSPHTTVLMNNHWCYTVLRFHGSENPITQNITNHPITTHANQIKTHICLVHHNFSSAQPLLQSFSTKSAEKYIIAPPTTIIISQSTIRPNISLKCDWINVKTADNGTWTRTSRAEVCYATPTTSYPQSIFQLL